MVSRTPHIAKVQSSIQYAPLPSPFLTNSPLPNRCITHPVAQGRGRTQLPPSALIPHSQAADLPRAPAPTAGCTSLVTSFMNPTTVKSPWGALSLSSSLPSEGPRKADTSPSGLRVYPRTARSALAAAPTCLQSSRTSALSSLGAERPPPPTVSPLLLQPEQTPVSVLYIVSSLQSIF